LIKNNYNKKENFTFMKINTKFLLPVSLLTVISLTACTSNAPTFSSIDQSSVNFGDGQLFSPAQEQNVFIVDVGNGKKTNASLSFKVNLDEVSKRFAIKNNVNGSAEKTAANVQSIKVWLVELTTGSPPTAGAPVTTVANTAFSYNNTSTSPLFTYSNIGPNTSGKSYYVAVAAYSVTASSQAPGNNITNKSTAANRVMISGEPAAISNGGGDTSGTNTGSVNISSGFAVSTTNGLSVGVILADANGANIDTSVSFTAGNPSIPATTVQ
jgi:hypothetical protein